MALTIINTGNAIEHVLVQGPDGKRDSAPIHPGRQTLPEGYTVVDTGVTLRHLRVLDPSAKSTVAEVAAKQAAQSTPATPTQATTKKE